MRTTLKRSLAIASMTLMTGGMLVTGGSPVSAATATASNVSGSSATQGYNDNDRGWRGGHRGRWVRAGEFRSLRACQRAGWRGERRDVWENWYCRRGDNNNWDRSAMNRRWNNDDCWVLYVRGGRHHGRW